MQKRLWRLRPPYRLCFGVHLPPSFAVISEWHTLQRDIRLSSAFVPPCDSGAIWCTSSAGVSLPLRLHIAQRGCAAIYLSRIRRHSAPYLFFISGERSYFSYLLASCLACSSQNRPSVSLGQPGYEHGRFGLYGIILSPFSFCTKKASAVYSYKGFYV